MQFHPGAVHGVIWKPLTRFNDSRGWLCELFRDDEVPEEFRPVMAYASVTEAGVARGPHEHVEQADFFCFIGPGDFKVYLWDIRDGSPTRGIFQAETVGESRPMALIVPPGVVHGYRNVSRIPALVFNCPNRLYKGWGCKEPVDEIRHEELENSPFVMD
jgi:dTDP-4-dehydrorhamnose 3,5-epimerase